MRLADAHIVNFRAIRVLDVSLDPRLTVLHGMNAQGKTSVLSAIAVGLGMIPAFYDLQDAPAFATADIGPGPNTYVRLRSDDGRAWERGTALQRRKRKSTSFTRSEMLYGSFPQLPGDRAIEGQDPLPVVAYYDTDRAILPPVMRKQDGDSQPRRLDAYEGALASRANFRSLFEWFFATENIELRRQRERHSFHYELPELQAVRAAITSMLPDISNPRIEAPARPRAWSSRGMWTGGTRT